MVDFHKLKNLGTDILGRAGDIAEQAKDKVAPLAEQAKDKVAPLAEQAKDKVAPLAGKAKDVAAKGVDKAAGGLDSATGHKYHHKLGAVTGNRDKNPTSSSAVDLNDPEPPAEVADGSDGVEADDVEAGGVEADDVADIAEPETVEPDGASPVEAADDSDQSEHHPTPADMPPHRAPDADTV